MSVSTGWVVLLLFMVAGFVVLFVLVTEGRYGGKRAMRWVYGRFGPSIYGSRTEADRWRALAGELQLRGDETILDAGAAVGDLLLTIAASHGHQGHVVGIDWAPRMAAVARAESRRRDLHRRASFAVADLRAPLPFRSGAFDTVVCLGVLETLPQPQSTLAELVRVLRPGGTLVLSVYKKGWWSVGGALSGAWYDHQLARLGLTDVRIFAFRQSQSVLLAH